MASDASPQTVVTVNDHRPSTQVEDAPTHARTRKGADTRLRLRQAAVQCIYELGYDTASVDRIVLRAGLTKGSFYHHFTSKEELLAEIHNDFMDAHLQELRAISATGQSPAEKIRSSIYCLVSGAKKYQKEEGIFFEEHRRLTGERYAEVKAKRDEFRNVIADFIAEGVKDGTFRPVEDPKVMSFGIVGMASWPYLWIADRGMTPEQIAEMYANTVLQGLTQHQQ